jgi:hypothetical protein
MHPLCLCTLPQLQSSTWQIADRRHGHAPSVLVLLLGS